MNYTKQTSYIIYVVMHTNMANCQSKNLKNHAIEKHIEWSKSLLAYNELTIQSCCIRAIGTGQAMAWSILSVFITFYLTIY